MPDNVTSVQNTAGTDMPPEEVFDLLLALLTNPRFSDKEKLDNACARYPNLTVLVEGIDDIRDATAALKKGDLDTPVSGQGYISSNLKAIQANFLHLVWQMTQVSKGDFSQRIDFLGEFSTSFNLMCERLEEQNALLAEQAQYDGLTKLANRQFLEQRLDRVFARFQKTGMPFALILIDIDYFKRVNDTYQHEAGDKVLVGVADYLRTVFRASDFVARYGGEEFVVVLPCTTSEIAKTIAERARTYFASHPIALYEGKSITVTVSIGVSESKREDVSWDQIIKRSDTALYKAKSGGRNCVEVL